MKCAVVSRGSSCQNTAIHPVNAGDGKIWLCERCFENVRLGAYGEKLKQAAQTAVSAINALTDSQPPDFALLHLVEWAREVV